MIEHDLILPHLYEPRDYQLSILQALDKGAKRAVWVVHRRGGKDLTIWNWVIKSLALKKQICFYVLPTYSQAKKVIWCNQTKEGVSFLDYVPKEIIAKKSESELSLTFTSGSYLQLIGSENIDRIMGTSPQIVVFSEAAMQTQQAWDYLRPILAENNGTAIFISTPRGKNWFYDLFEMSKANPNWFGEKLTVVDTAAITAQAIDEERKAGMSEDMIEQEFYCSFDLGIEGSYYSKYIDTMRKENRIGNVPWDPATRVYTAWDLGIGDDTAIIYFQLVGNEIHVIDYYEANGEALTHYATLMEKKTYLYEKHYAPHDIEVRELSTALSRRAIALQLGIEFIVLPTLTMKVEDGIEIARGTFPRLWIDQTKCKKLLRHLENYHKEFDDKRNCYRDRPIHDDSSHGADAFRYMCIAIKAGYTGSTSMTKEEYRRWKAEQGWR